MTRSTVGLLLALCFLVSLIVSAPARLLSLFLPAGQVVAQGFDGTVWRGSASRCLVRTTAGYLQLGAVQWSLDPLSLLWFAPRISLSTAWGGQTVAGDVVVRGSGKLDLHALEALLPADLLRQFVPVVLVGTFSVQVQTLQLREGLPRAGSGRLVWQDGGWQAPQGLLPLGSYALDFQQAPGEQLQGQVLTLSGPLAASGTVRLQDRSYEVDVLLSGQAPLEPQLEQALSLVAASGPEGFRVKLNGEI